jgi:drug/metabolite transporter (DMT)-like permease
MPMLFVGIWATGFIVARLVAPHADPLTFVSVRFVLSAAAFAALAFAARAPWPRGVAAWRNAVLVGVLMQSVYIGGVFWSVRHGLPAGISALVTGLQPLLTAMLSFWLLGERVTGRRWCGIAMGFAGAVMVLEPQWRGASGVGMLPLSVSGVAMLGMTLGTILQKRTGSSGDVRAGAAVQFGGAAAVTVPLAMLTEQGRFDGSWEVWAGLAWAVGGLSLGAVSLLLLLLRRNAVAGVASLFYLTPPVVAVVAYLAFGEALNGLQVAGLAVAAAGVALASRRGNEG